MLTCVVDHCDKPRGGSSRMCYMHHGRWYRTGSLDKTTRTWQDRFWTKVDKGGDCWPWTGATSGGYGVLGDAPDRYAHRLAYMLATGAAIPNGMCVCHHCDTPRCVNPAHLFLGDIPTNQQDMSEKQRSTWGTRSAHAKLTEDDVHEIRRLLAAGTRHADIAAQFNVSRPTISMIFQRKTWRHLSEAS